MAGIQSYTAKRKNVKLQRYDNVQFLKQLEKLAKFRVFFLSLLSVSPCLSADLLPTKPLITKEGSGKCAEGNPLTPAETW